VQHISRSTTCSELPALVADKQACGTLTVASNMLLLATLKAVRSGLRLGLKVGTTLFVRAEATYTATLHTSAVRQIPVTVVRVSRPMCLHAALS